MPNSSYSEICNRQAGPCWPPSLPESASYQIRFKNGLTGQRSSLMEAGKHGVFGLVRISDFRFDFVAGAALQRSPRQPHIVPHAAQARSFEDQTAALLSGR